MRTGYFLQMSWDYANLNGLLGIISRRVIYDEKNEFNLRLFRRDTPYAIARLVSFVASKSSSLCKSGTIDYFI